MPPGSAVAVPVLAVAVAFAALCLVDLRRAPRVRPPVEGGVGAGHLRLEPLGRGLAYLIFGRDGTGPAAPAPPLPAAPGAPEAPGPARRAPPLAGRTRPTRC